MINRALAGEEMIITRHGKPVVEIRPTSVPEPVGKDAALARLLAHHAKLAPGARDLRGVAEPDLRRTERVTLYLDASAIVPTLIEEGSSRALGAIVPPPPAGTPAGTCRIAGGRRG
jgi:antitoxin (DNA-binding transcriptional repressor) of toxin-antitoxin stability system